MSKLTLIQKEKVGVNNKNLMLLLKDKKIFFENYNPQKCLANTILEAIETECDAIVIHGVNGSFKDLGVLKLPCIRHRKPYTTEVKKYSIPEIILVIENKILSDLRALEIDFITTDISKIQ